MRLKEIISLAVILILLGAIVVILQRPGTAQGSIQEGQSYKAATTTYAFTQSVVKTGQGTLGSIVITGDNTGTLALYNATTSDVNKRTGNRATSSILLVDLPASAPEGTYTLDVEFTDGLLMVGSGFVATSSVTYR